MDQDEVDEDEEMDGDDNTNNENVTATGQTTPSTAAPLSRIQSRTSLPSLNSLPSVSHLTTTATLSPSLRAYDGRHFSISSTSAASYSPYMHSQNTSPLFGPQGSLPLDASTLALTSPALRAQDAAGLAGQRDDREAMAALLMLNSDRRSWKDNDSSQRVSRSSKGGGAMSVKDLLSN